MNWIQSAISKFFPKKSEPAYTPFESEEQCRIKLRLFAKGFRMDACHRLSLALTNQWERLSPKQLLELQHDIPQLMQGA